MNSSNIACSRCVYDTTIRGIRFDEFGVCNFCKTFEKMEALYPLGEAGKSELNRLVESIKRAGEGREFDCVLGVSGGCDSTFTLWYAKQLGLRPLAVHFDNGWNTEIAVSNIRNSIERLDVPLQTWVADWEEFKNLQLSFLKASVPDVEITTDVTITAVLHKIAADEGIKYILVGSSFRTEGIAPPSWSNMDGRYIDDVHKKYGSGKITSFPKMKILNFIYYRFIKRIHAIPILNYIDYDKKNAAVILERELGWKDYGGHHHESHITVFLQSYVFPKKFKIDKRKLTLSARIRMGKISRAEALNILETEYELNPETVEYARKKFGLSKEELQAIMNEEPRSQKDFKNYFELLKPFKPIIYLMTKFRIIPSIIYYKFFS